ncbi:uncharacterized protein LOC129573993 [Sitodiplosis mosellana]|uniref:uncharacterized protein LOC129573993 n=1 Tax=Sitodiplosis mosellana TaxID=263140 RepID=UPI002444E339|nr:uncharacterized protein LOC129573993 [Sitodiplosis mosellana]
MAMNINQTNNAFGINAATFMPAKTMDARSESDKKKVALGDIKNAPAAPTSGGKTTTKKVETEKMAESNDDYEYASSRPVDWFPIWIEAAALSDDLINKMARQLTGRDIDPNEEIEPPKYYEIEDKIYPQTEEITPEIPPEIQEFPPMSPDSSSSEYHSFDSFDGDFEEDIKPSTQSFYNDSEMSALNQSVFEFSSDSEDSFAE